MSSARTVTRRRGGGPNGTRYRHRLAPGDRGRGGGAAGHRLGRGRRGEHLPRPSARGADPASLTRHADRPARRITGPGWRGPPVRAAARGPGRAGDGTRRAPGHRTHRVRTGRRRAHRIPAAGGGPSAACAAHLGRTEGALRERPHRTGLPAGAAGTGEHRGADLLARRGAHGGPVPGGAGRADGRGPADRRGQPPHQPRQPRREPGDGARRTPGRGDRVRPRGGRHPTRRHLARHPRAPGHRADPGHPVGPAGTGVPARGSAGA